MLGCDVLGDIRAAIRKLRHAERWLTQCERDQKRAAKKDRERLVARGFRKT
jgi:hypothetical protein